jgi:hypothetical protein
MNKRKSIAEIEAEESEEEVDGILRDGQSVRVSLFMRDGAINPDLTPTQRGKALHQTQAEDAIARRYGLEGVGQLHKPGFRRNSDAAALARVQQAYTDAETADANAWKGGHLRQGHAKVAPAPDQPQDPGLDAREAAYLAYDEEMATAYLRGK